MISDGKQQIIKKLGWMRRSSGLSHLSVDFEKRIPGVLFAVFRREKR